jgi:hypothetical protein
MSGIPGWCAPTPPNPPTPEPTLTLSCTYHFASSIGLTWIETEYIANLLDPAVTCQSERFRLSAADNALIVFVNQPPSTPLCSVTIQNIVWSVWPADQSAAGQTGANMRCIAFTGDPSYGTLPIQP